MEKLADIWKAGSRFEQARIGIRRNQHAKDLLERAPKVRFAIEKGRQALLENLNTNVVPDVANEAIEMAESFSEKAAGYSNEDK